MLQSSLQAIYEVLAYVLGSNNICKPISQISQGSHMEFLVCSCCSIRYKEHSVISDKGITGCCLATAISHYLNKYSLYTFQVSNQIAA